MKLLRRRFLHLAGVVVAVAVLAVTLSGHGARSQAARTIKIVVPLAAGGGVDFAARLVGEYLTHSMGQQVYIENKTGAGGTIGFEAAAKSAPDGYTVLIANDNLASAPHVMKVNIDYAKVLVR
jgi:tripartite-type tricarboxylate transporter receptor subunit TctC